MVTAELLTCSPVKLPLLKWPDSNPLMQWPSLAPVYPSASVQMSTCSGMVVRHAATTLLMVAIHLLFSIDPRGLSGACTLHSSHHSVFDINGCRAALEAKGLNVHGIISSTPVRNKRTPDESQTWYQQRVAL